MNVGASGADGIEFKGTIKKRLQWWWFVGLAIRYGRSLENGVLMRESLRAKAIAICDAKIAQKGEGVGLSFYAFFANRNYDPPLLMEAATWWIKTHKLDHFEKAVKIRALVASGA